jgi:cellulose synthase/poly-beta-1,6-N-acetylglucosamine synthase-like glycosyltransferase
MRLMLWVSLSFVFYTYVGYPLLIWILGRLWPRPWRASPITPSVSVVLAVHNGASVIAKRIRQLLGLDYPNIHEIIVVSDGSTDGTAEILARQTDSFLRTVVLKERCGKAAAVNAAIAIAKGEIIVFVDIRPEIAPEAIRQLVGNFADPNVGCVAGQLLLRREGHDDTTAAIGGLYWRYEAWIRRCESRFDSPVGVYGGFYAVRRDLAARQPPEIILDDLFQPLSIIRRGYRSVLDPEAYVYDTWPAKVQKEFDRKVRTLAGNFQFLQVAPWSLTPQNRVLFQFVSHKVMRLIVPYMLILLLISTAWLARDSAFYRGFVLLQAAGWLVATVSLRVRVPLLHRIAAPAGALLVLNAAAVVGLYRFFMTRGPLWKIWTPSELLVKR